ncbi:UDP-N-acetylglucosamine 2-epimerase [Solitalea canadensis]|uniref:UDP-N-acetylglucosamine 2-epimerase n=1 Tax=Solitalea canadensis TaxID=995 RepID=UPI00031146E1|nr:UDP-N-acetylglucosamine 2-epimerase [Solitalea canadensis]
MNKKHPHRIAILTSSRADYGIYLPLLHKLGQSDDFDLRIITFGTHLSRFHGYTIDQIVKDGFFIDHQVETVLASDTEQAIADSMALTMQKFSGIWSVEKNNYDLVFCLGDRYEMFAAVAAAVPFNIKFAHIHGGETTLGAIDNKFRHCLSLFSMYHFTSTKEYSERVSNILGSNKNIYNVGALSLDNINDMDLYSKEDFLKVFGIDITKESVLVTFHPETVSVDENKKYVEEVIAALDKLDYQIIITMPNTDTMGNMMRKEYEHFISKRPNVIGIESFGTKGYFTCMKYSKFLLGNTSSGIIEAASFNKYVVNVGDRQKGRAFSPNLIQVHPDRTQILEACEKVKLMGDYNGENIYHKEDVADGIINILKREL